MTQIQKANPNIAANMGHHIVMVSRLLFDSRVPLAGRVVMWLAVAYWLWPADFVAVVPGLSALDDLTILFIAQSVMVGLTPPNIIKEYRRKSK
ncbi:MAG: hypothetical protein FGM61_09750 [Sediminibacterium sp.]|nr:hypothetical protein [Sediminibacterium sp.]